MKIAPQYLLMVETTAAPEGAAWRFLLHRSGSDWSVAASDTEPGISVNRGEVLALVRGLEAIDEPGCVMLFTASRYLNRAVGRGLAHWRAQDWHWESFGRRVPVRNADLWQRVDRALEFHTLRCQQWSWGTATWQADRQSAPVATRRRRVLTVASVAQQTIDRVRRGMGQLLDVPQLASAM